MNLPEHKARVKFQVAGNKRPQRGFFDADHNHFATNRTLYDANKVVYWEYDEVYMLDIKEFWVEKIEIFQDMTKWAEMSWEQRSYAEHLLTKTQVYKNWVAHKKNKQNADRTT